MYKPTQSTPPPYKNAPLTTRDIIMQQVEFEDKYYPHLVYTHSKEVMRKELPSGKWNPAAQYVFGNNIMRFAHALLP